MSLPLFGFVPETTADKTHQSSFNTIATTPEMAILATLMVGYTFDL